MKLYERFSDPGYHTSIVTTFGVDFDAYESIALARLRGAGCNNNIVVVDRAMLSYALSGASTPPRFAGRHYTLAEGVARNVFHPKLILQVGRKGGRLIVASANQTASGLAGNLEIAGDIRCGLEDSGERRLIASAWRYLDTLLANAPGVVQRQLDWMRSKAFWLRHASPAPDRVELADGTQAAFLATGDEALGARFLRFLDRPVERLIVMSPYWDDLEALAALSDTLGDPPLALLVDTKNGLFPKQALQRLANATVYDIGAVAQKRFAHAKLIIAETAEHEHVLFGSANCTVAALGRKDWPGDNQEACLYRRLPRGAVLTKLKLSGLFETAVPAAAIAAFVEEEPLPLKDMAAGNPGAFEARFDILHWRLPKGVTADASLELLGADMQPLAVQLVPLGEDNANERRFRIVDATERPAFARVRHGDGRVSLPAIVTLADVVQDGLRERRPGRVETIVQQLSEETELGLWLAESLDVLDAAEAEQRAEAAPARRLVRPSAEADEQASEGRTISYEQFIAGRRLRSDAASGNRTSFLGSDLSLVDSFLNRILDPASAATEADTEAEASLLASFNRGDENDDPGGNVGSDEQPPIKKPLSTDEQRRRAAETRASRDKIVAAIARFSARAAEAAKRKRLTPVDVLRLRAMLMIVCATGYGRDSEANALSPSSLQVLPPVGPESWPVLLGKTLFAFFDGPQPVIRYLEVDASFEDLPRDLLAAWIACMGAAQMGLVMARRHKELSGIAKPFERLVERIYALTGLAPADLQGEDVQAGLERMLDRFADRLGLSRQDVLASHCAAKSSQSIQT